MTVVVGEVDDAVARTLDVAYAVVDGVLQQTTTSDRGSVVSEGAGWSQTDGPLRAAWLRHHLLGGTTRPVGSVPVRQVTAAELFSASGGLAVGFGSGMRDLGLRLVSEGALDQDAEALGVYAANHQTRIRSVTSASDIVDFRVSGVAGSAEFTYEPEVIDPKWSELRKLGVLLAGPPCQGHSNLNNRTRRADERNQLYLTVPAIAVALEVEVVVIENVPAVVHDQTRVVQTAVQLLVDNGYEVAEGVLAAHKMGWPQTRQRYFVVACRGRTPIPLASVEAALALDDASSALPVAWALHDDDLLAAYDDRLHVLHDYNEENQRRINYLHETDEYDLPSALRPDCHKDGTTYNAVYGRMHADRPAPTLTTGFMTPGRGRYIHPSLPRTLTALEAACIQGFPASYNFFPDPTNPPTKAKLAKWIGDAVPYPLGYAAALSAFG